MLYIKGRNIQHFNLYGTCCNHGHVKTCIPLLHIHLRRKGYYYLAVVLCSY